MVQRIVEWSKILEEEQEEEKGIGHDFVGMEVAEMITILQAEEELERVWEGQNLKLGDLLLGVVEGDGRGVRERVVFCRFQKGMSGGMSVFTGYRESAQNTAVLTWKQASPIPGSWKEKIQGNFPFSPLF